MVVYLSALCLLSFAMENTSRARHRRPLNCADLYGPQTSRPLRLQPRVLSRRLKDDDLATVDTTGDRKPSPRCHASLTSSLFLPSCPRCSLPSGPVSVTRCYLPCARVSVTHGLPGESSSSGLSACPFGAGSLYFFTLFLLVRRLSSFILLRCLYNSNHRIYIKKIWFKKKKVLKRRRFVVFF